MAQKFSLIFPYPAGLELSRTISVDHCKFTGTELGLTQTTVKIAESKE